METNHFIGQSLNLSALVAYQEGGVVSREILRNPSGTITVFAFDQGQGLSEHTSPYNAFVLVYEGEAEITIDGKKQIVGQGEVIIMPANRPHALHAVKRFRMLLVLVKD